MAVDKQSARMVAMGYVWGWEDAGGELPAVGLGHAFAEAYSIVANEYNEARAMTRPSVRSAWREWVTDYRLSYTGGQESGYQTLAVVALSDGQGGFKVQIAAVKDDREVQAS